LSEGVTGLFSASAATFAASSSNEGQLQQLYQRFRGWARFFRSTTPDQSASHTIRTEVTVQRESTTLLVSGTTAFDFCPLCGQQLAPAQAEQARLRLQKGSSTGDCNYRR
jgi:hypothetical protein